MRMVSTRFPEKIEIDDSAVTSFVIEKEDLYLKVARDLFCQSKGEGGEIILSENDSILKISNSVELITDFVGFEPDNKKILSKISKMLESDLQQGDHYYAVMELLTKIEQLMDDVSERFPFSLSFEGINIGALIKMTSPRIIDDSDSDIMHIYNYMETIREVLGERLFVMVGMRGYFSDQDMQAFVNNVVSHKYQVLLLECRESALLDNERRMILDNDICVI